MEGRRRERIIREEGKTEMCENGNEELKHEDKEGEKEGRKEERKEKDK